MNWLVSRAVRWLLGPAAVEGVTDEMLDGITLAIQEEADRMGLVCAHMFAPASQSFHCLTVQCIHCDETRHNCLPTPGWQACV